MARREVQRSKALTSALAADRIGRAPDSILEGVEERPGETRGFPLTGEPSKRAFRVPGRGIDEEACLLLALV